ncbi:adhesion G-protein coupled receptor D1-like [Anneissia japonica]|uniref:adhesion G-protein coupled receptor D1-like n=1 Tax=Anneissia japonica TaxID=1529436 RepID=UPI001425A5AD|nr:adhesion G-protein coupled receptor D1-like [Anneissia japonica]
MTASFVVDGAKISNPVNFRLNTKKNITSNDRYVCAFWKKDINIMHWSEYGCGKDNSGECSCNHTTSFGILVQVADVPNGHERALNYITYIGCGISLAALFITITILMCIPSLNSTRIAIHKNFVLSLIFAEIVFLVGPLGENKEVICQFITLSMHYLWLSVFFWMLMEGLHLYLLVVKVYRSGKSYLHYYVVTAWGCPIVIVAFSASLKWQDYKSESICWLSLENDMIWAFLGPAAVIVVVNLLILIRVLFVVVGAVDDVNGVPSKVTQTKAAAKSAIVLAPILGTTWLIGVAANLNTVCIYLFTIFNSLQGVFVFVFYCVRNSEVRNSIDRIRQKRALTKSNEKNTLSTCAKSKVGSIDNIFQMKPK